MTEVQIDTDYITLSQFLKMIDVIQSGGHAKFFLEENQVYVNGEAEARRGKKLYHGDKVMVLENEYLIQSNQMIS